MPPRAHGSAQEMARSHPIAANLEERGEIVCEVGGGDLWDTSHISICMGTDCKSPDTLHGCLVEIPCEGLWHWSYHQSRNPLC